MHEWQHQPGPPCIGVVRAVNIARTAIERPSRVERDHLARAADPNASENSGTPVERSQAVIEVPLLNIDDDQAGADLCGEVCCRPNCA